MLFPFLVGVGFYVLSHSCDARDVRVLIIDWLTDIIDIPWDLEITSNIGVHFILAMLHFNDRNTEIYPSIKSVPPSCQNQIKIVGYCDDNGNMNRGVDILSEFSNEYDVIVGANSAAVKAIVPTAEAFAQAPVISHWTSFSSMDNSDLYPLFSQTYISDFDLEFKLAEFVRYLNFTRIVLLVEDEPSVRDPVNTFLTILNDHFPQIHALVVYMKFLREDSSPLEEVFRSERNCIVYFGWTLTIVQDLHVFASERNLNSTHHQWIFANTDIMPNHVSMDNDPHLASFLQGAFHVHFETKNDSLMNRFLNRFPHEFSHLVPVVNQYFPPSGFQNDSYSCKHSPLKHQVKENFFSNLDPTIKHITWFTAYDAIMAIGLASCRQLTDNRTLKDHLLDLDFEGLSGRVRFQKNKRDSDFVQFIASNFQLTAQGKVRLVPVGFWNQTGFQLTQPFQFRGTELPLDFVQPPIDMNLLPQGLKVIGYVEFFVCLILCLSCFVWLHSHQHHPLVRIQQPYFLKMCLYGCALASISLLALTMDDFDQVGYFPYCVSQYAFFFVGSQMALGSLGGKTMRYRALTERFHREKRFCVSVRCVSFFVLFLVGLDVFVILLFEHLDPMIPQRVPVAWDRHECVLATQLFCTRHATSFWYFFPLLFFLLFEIFVFRVWICTSKMHAEKQMCFSLGQAIGVSIPGVIAVMHLPVGKFVVLSTTCLVCILVTLFFTFFPLVFPKPREFPHVEDLSFHRSSMLDDQVIDVQEGIKIPAVLDKFFVYISEQGETGDFEAFFFLLDALAYKDSFETSTMQSRVSQLRFMKETYFLSGAILELPSSEKSRDRILVVSGPTEDIFDHIIVEACTKLNSSAWKTFVQDGGMYSHPITGE